MRQLDTIRTSRLHPECVMTVTMNRLIVVEDDSSVRNAIAEFLSLHDYDVATADDAQDASEQLQASKFDLAIVDVMLPGEDGLSLCRRLSESGLPILIVSALSSTTARIIGLDTGAADYLPKPFDPRELLARVRAILRRNPARPSDRPELLHFAGLEFDAANAALRRADGTHVAVTAHELRLLATFLERPARLLSRGTLLDLTRHGDEEPFERAIDLAVSRLRRKLRLAGAGDVIETVRGLGYRLVAKVEPR